MPDTKPTSSVSGESVYWAIRDIRTIDKTITFCEQNILYTLATTMGTKGYSYYSLEILSEKCCIHKTNLIKNLKNLIHKGYVFIIKLGKAGRSFSNHYSINVLKIIGDPDCEQPVDNSPEKVAEHYLLSKIKSTNHYRKGSAALPEKVAEHYPKKEIEERNKKQCVIAPPLQGRSHIVQPRRIKDFEKTKVVNYLSIEDNQSRMKEMMKSLLIGGNLN